MLRFNPVLFCLLFFCANASAQDYEDDVNRKIDSLRSSGVDTILFFRSHEFGSGFLEYTGDRICDQTVYLIWAASGVTNIQKYQECFDEQAESLSTVVGDVRQIEESPLFSFLSENFTAIMTGKLKPSVAKIELANVYHYREIEWSHSFVEFLKVYLKDTVLINSFEENDVRPLALLYMSNVNYAYNRSLPLTQMISMLNELVTELYSDEPWFKTVNGDITPKDSVIIVEDHGHTRVAESNDNYNNQLSRYVFWKTGGKTYCQKISDCYGNRGILIKTFKSNRILLGNSDIFKFLQTHFKTLEGEVIKPFSSGAIEEPEMIKLIRPLKQVNIGIQCGERKIELRFAELDLHIRAGEWANINYATNNNTKTVEFIEMIFDTIKRMEQEHLFIIN